MSYIVTGKKTGLRLQPNDLATDSFTIIARIKPNAIMAAFAPYIALSTNTPSGEQMYLAVSPAGSNPVVAIANWDAYQSASLGAQSTATFLKCALRGYRDGDGDPLLRATFGATHQECAQNVAAINSIMFGHNVLFALPGLVGLVAVWDHDLTDAQTLAELASETRIITAGLVGEYPLTDSLAARLFSRPYAAQLLPFADSGSPDTAGFSTSQPTFDGGAPPEPEPEPTADFTTEVPVPPGEWRLEVTTADGTGTAVSDFITFLGITGGATISANPPAGVMALQVVPVLPATSLSVLAGQSIQVQLQDVNGGSVLDGSGASTNTALASVTRTLAGTFTVAAPAGTQGPVALNFSYNDPSNGLLTKQVTLQINAVADVPGTPAVTLAANSPTSVRATIAVADQLASGVQLQWSTDSAAATNPSYTWPNTLTLGATPSPVNISNLVPGSSVYVRVRATATAGNSQYSTVQVVQTPADNSLPAPTISMVVSQVSVSAAGLLILTASGTGISGVRFYRGTQLLGAEVTSEPYRVTVPLTASDNGSLTFMARAYNANRDSADSAPVTVQVAIAPSVTVPAPSSPAAVAQSASVVLLSANNNAGPGAVLVAERSTSRNGTYTPTRASTPGVASMVDTSLLASTTYWYRFQSQTADGSSGYTDPISVRTLDSTTLALASLTISRDQLSGVSGASVPLVVTALDANGSTMPGVSITPELLPPELAALTPTSAVTNAQGQASFSVRFQGDSGADGNLTFHATDGVSSAQKSVRVFVFPVFTSALLEQLKAPDPKFPEEVHPYVFDFRSTMVKSGLAEGESIVGTPEVEVVPYGGTSLDPDANEMLFGPPSVVNQNVLQFLRDGKAGLSYIVRCHISTSIGRKVTAEIRVRVYATPGRRAERL